MTNKKMFWLVISAGVLVLLIVIIYFVGLSGKTKAPEPKVSQQKTPEQINKSIEAVTESTKVEAPSANPYQDVPSLNPVEQANPFRELKTNPFSR